MLLSGNSSLAALTFPPASSAPSVFSAIGERALEPLRTFEVDTYGALQESHRHPPVFKCPFYFLSCRLTFSTFSEWVAHSLQHFHNIHPPNINNCCYCEQTFQNNDGIVSWKAKMEHIALHYQLGHEVTHARPDFELYRYLWKNRLVDKALYKSLVGDSNSRTSAASAYPVAPIYHLPDNTSLFPVHTSSQNSRQRMRLDSKSRTRPHKLKARTQPDAVSFRHRFAPRRPESVSVTTLGTVASPVPKLTMQYIQPTSSHSSAIERHEATSPGYSDRERLRMTATPFSFFFGRSERERFTTPNNLDAPSDNFDEEAYDNTNDETNNETVQMQGRHLLHIGSDGVDDRHHELHQPEERGERTTLVQPDQNFFEDEAHSSKRPEKVEKTGVVIQDALIAITHVRDELHEFEADVSQRTLSKYINPCVNMDGNSSIVRHGQQMFRNIIALAERLFAFCETSQNSARAWTFGPPFLPSGMKRISWSCHCGHRSLDDFKELREGAVTEYAARLQQRLTESESNGRVTRSGVIGVASRIFHALFMSMSLPQRAHQPSLERFETTPMQLTTPVTSRSDSLFLLLCLPYHNRGTKLLQLDLRDVQDDLYFFSLLRHNYREIRGRLKRSFSLRTVKSIKFVQFELRRSQLVNIRKEDDLPPETLREEYTYDPMPADMIPPLGENYMMHLFAHPDHADPRAKEDLNRIPKKLKDRLAICPTQGRGIGWGVHFIEGWHLSALSLVAYLVFLIASLVFFVCWAVLKQDVQGASGVAAYILAFTTLSVGSVQAAFELELM